MTRNGPIIPQQCQEQLDPASWVMKLADSLREVHQFARDNLRTSQARQKRDYDLRVVVPGPSKLEGPSKGKPS
jgi:hypothetical protein